MKILFAVVLRVVKEWVRLAGVETRSCRICALVIVLDTLTTRVLEFNRLPNWCRNQVLVRLWLAIFSQP
jgi:hypothetical protein